MTDVTTIQVEKHLHKRLRIISAYSDKKLFELIEECIVILEEKYNIPRQNTEEL